MFKKIQQWQIDRQFKKLIIDHNASALELQACLKKGANPNQIINGKAPIEMLLKGFDYRGTDGLVKRLSIDRVKVLLEAPVDINLRSPWRISNIHYPHDTILHQMLMLRVEPEVLEEILTLALQKKPHFTAIKDHNSPLHVAVLHQCSVAVVEKLIKAGALINAQGVGQVTVLHSAVRNHDKAMLECLIGLGANLFIKDESGLTAYDLAKTFKSDIGGIYESLMEKRGLDEYFSLTDSLRAQKKKPDEPYPQWVKESASRVKERSAQKEKLLINATNAKPLATDTSITVQNGSDQAGAESIESLKPQADTQEVVQRSRPKARRL